MKARFHVRSTYITAATDFSMPMGWFDGTAIYSTSMKNMRADGDSIVLEVNVYQNKAFTDALASVDGVSDFQVDRYWATFELGEMFDPMVVAASVRSAFEVGFPGVECEVLDETVDAPGGGPPDGKGPLSDVEADRGLDVGGERYDIEIKEGGETWPGTH